MKTIFIIVLLFGHFSVLAHETRPAIADVTFNKNATVDLRIQTNIEAMVAGINAKFKNTNDAPEAEYYKQLRGLSATDLEQKFLNFEPSFRVDIHLLLAGQKPIWTFKKVVIPPRGDIRISRISEIFYQAELTPGMTSATWQYDTKYGDAVVRFITEGSDNKTSHWLTNGKTSPEFILTKAVIPRQRWVVAWDYVVLGYEHIVPKGIDHILFVLGLFLLSLKLRPLFWQVTAFTLAHSITLGLTIYGVIQLSSLIVEPLIALSIAYVGIENMLTRELKPWRVLVVFLFGLLHGMGFAGVLLELGLPESEFLTALITFNVGVEFGQISVILVALILVGWLSKKPELYRKFVVLPGSLVISITGLFWTWQRIFG